MAARSKAQKLRLKRGRPKAEGAREPNGRLSRSGIDHDAADSVAISARVRMLGITKDQAMDQKAGSFIGYLNMLGPRDGLSEGQYEAAMEYLRLRERMLRAIQSQAAIYDPEARGSGSAEISEAYENWCRTTLEEWKTLKDEIQAEQNYCRGNLWAALHLVIIEGQAMHHMIGETRLLCNVFARHFKTMTESRHAA